MNTKNIIAISIVFLSVTSCSQDFVLDEGTDNSFSTEKANSTLIVKTRVSSTNGKATVSLPVNIYVFNAKNVCVGTTSIQDEGSSIQMKLAKGTYNVYAVSGATSEDYELPGQGDAEPTSTVTLKEGKMHGELMAGQSAVSMGKNQENTLTLALKRKVMQLRSVVINDVPTAVTGISITFSPLYSNLVLNGSKGDANGSQRIELEKSEENDMQWKLASPQYMLEPSGDANITVEMTQGDTRKTYTYISKNELKANSHIDIEGTYAYEFELSGTITGEEWGEDKKITFELSDEEIGGTGSDTPSEPNTPSGDENQYGKPLVGQFYANNQCFVVSSKDNSDGTVSYLLMTKKEKNSIFSESIAKKELPEITEIVKNSVSSLAISGISGWRLPSLSELKSVDIKPITIV